MSAYMSLSELQGLVVAHGLDWSKPRTISWSLGHRFIFLGVCLVTCSVSVSDVKYVQGCQYQSIMLNLGLPII